MLYSLMNKDVETLRFDLDDSYIQVIDNKHLPFPLRDYIKTTGEKDLGGSLGDLTKLRDFLASRTLNLSRENAKVILNVAALPQSLDTNQRLKIVMACSALSMQDNYWVKKDGDSAVFGDVCLRHKRLSEASYDIAILGKHISATRDELVPDLSTEGMFPKYWHRRDDGAIELWKTDKFTGNINTKCEIKASAILDNTGVDHVRYRMETKDGKVFSVCECMADDNKSFVPVQNIMDWYSNMGMDFKKGIYDLFKRQVANMCVTDYVLANTDRHSGNWGVMTNSNNDVIGFAPIFDMNQALVADEFSTDISDLIYEPFGLRFEDSVKNCVKDSTVDFTSVKGLPDAVRNRAEHVAELKSRSHVESDSLVVIMTENDLLRSIYAGEADAYLW